MYEPKRKKLPSIVSIKVTTIVCLSSYVSQDTVRILHSTRWGHGSSAASAAPLQLIDPPAKLSSNYQIHMSPSELPKAREKLK